MYIHPGPFQDAHHLSMHNPHFFDVHHGNVNIQMTKPSSDIEKYRKWLMPCDPSANHKNAVAKHHPGTGLWLLEHDVYKDWKEKENSFLWIHGISGAGKTIIFSTVVQDLQSIANKNSKGTVGLAYFYCDVSDVKKRSVTDILSSLVINLLAFQPSNQSLLDKTYQDSMNGFSKPFDDRLQEILRQFISSFEMAYILIDALDECLDWESALNFIQTLHGWGLWQCHLLVTSRREQQIVKSMMAMNPMEVEMLVDDDIQDYIDFMLNSSLELKEWGPEEGGFIRKVLLEKAKGMFRWVACQLDELKKCTKRRKTLNHVLENLPETLEGTYDQILSRIASADASCAAKLLLWLAFSKQPLHIDYLAVVVEFNLEENVFYPDARLSSSTDVLKICSTLVTRMGDNTETHPSIPFFRLDEPNQKRYQQSLIRYAAKHWAKHLLQVNCDTPVVQQIKRLFVLTSFGFQNWVKVYNYEIELPYPGHEAKCMWSQSLLQCAALHGVNVIVKWLLPSVKQIDEIIGAFNSASLHQHLDIIEVLLQEVERATEVIVDGSKEREFCLMLGENAKANLMGGLYGHALQTASYGGNVKIVQILLKRGADINTQGPYGNALQTALYARNNEIAKLLLEQGADVNAQGVYHGSALQAALSGGNSEIVRILLDRGADVNAQGGDYGNALQAASYRGNNEIVKVLLEQGADVNAQGGYYGNALQAASYQGNNEIVQILLEKGADANAQGGHYGNALNAASYEGKSKIVKVLLEQGADMNAQGGYHGNALQAASHKGNNEIVQILLEKGANVNVQGGEYGNALQAASWSGHKDIVQVLLEQEADVNAQGGHYGNAFLAAVSRGHEEIVHLLLSRGADVNVQGDEHTDSALQVASRNGQKDSVQLLLERGADVNGQGGYYGSSLQAASYQGNNEIVQILLEKGADANAKGGHYGNSLQAASLHGDEEIVCLLLERGADVNAQGGHYGSALQPASSAWRNNDIVQILLSQGADVNAQGGHYGNALQAASYRGNNSIFKILLSHGADVNAQGGHFGNALQAALCGRHKDIVHLLLAGGVNVMAQGGYYGNPLQAASYRGDNEIVQLLLDRGADANTQGGYYGNALQAASFHGHIITLALLLKAGANVSYASTVQVTWEQYPEQQTVELYNALQAASFNGHMSIVKLLLDHGVDQAQLETALHSAMEKGHKRIVDLLLKHGAKQK
ncbi:ankyrin repeat-containing domain protein [Amanita rubescens]|nr:ankyrin repeat-containing domain protein [Amanita rubescens]